ncbi:MAG: galactitol-1-phosphate 5-dehydrogenase [Lachnospiraceae bacterium]|nr:galactitol-1-phosphate 5-dehydrogenase [Lachnospiraceae bacterium]
MENQERMKALVLHGVGDLRYEDVEKKNPGKGEVLLKIKACGICSSDIPRIYTTGTYHFPTIPGHEFSGQIVALGEEVDEKLLGRRAAVFPLLPCRQCAPCAQEAYAQCKNYNYFGSRCDGAYAEYLVVPVWNLILFDDMLDYKIAALCEPSAVGLHAIKIAQLEAGQTVVIVGSGTIAFLIASFAKNMGASRVVICGRSEAKLDFARKLGFDTINTKNDQVEEDTKALFGGEGADVVFECVGKASTAENAIQACSAFGTVVLVGNPEGDMTFEKNVYWKILRQQITAKGTWNSSYSEKVNDWEEALRSMARDPEAFAALITQTYPLSDYEAAMNTVKDSSRFRLKVVFEM